MHDGRLLSDNEMEIAELTGQTVPAIQATKRLTGRVNFWAIVAFCVAGLVCALYVPSSYLHIEQTSVLLAEAPLS
jgi:type VI protein secretion system component VasF